MEENIVDLRIFFKEVSQIIKNEVFCHVCAALHVLGVMVMLVCSDALHA